MIPRDEPNSIPPLFSDRSDWRETYAAYVAYFKASAGTVSDEVYLRIRLKRLGFDGTRLDAEVTYIKEASI